MQINGEHRSVVIPKGKGSPNLSNHKSKNVSKKVNSQSQSKDKVCTAQKTQTIVTCPAIRWRTHSKSSNQEKKKSSAKKSQQISRFLDRSRRRDLESPCQQSGPLAIEYFYFETPEDRRLSDTITASNTKADYPNDKFPEWVYFKLPFEKILKEVRNWDTSRSKKEC